MIVHILAIIGLIYVCINSQYLMKTFLALCIIHNLGAIGITAGAHRLWSHRAYSASFIWKFVVMLLNSSIFIIIIFLQMPIKVQFSIGVETTDYITNSQILISIHILLKMDSFSHMWDGYLRKNQQNLYNKVEKQICQIYKKTQQLCFKKDIIYY